jgi:uncharacterized protein
VNSASTWPTLRACLAAALAVTCACTKATRGPPKAQSLARDTDLAERARVCVGPGALPPRTDAKNVLGEPLQACPSRHLTGFNRNGYCNTGPDDQGVHVVCAAVSDAFLAFTKTQGNDLSTARASFPGLKAGDAWCLCANRWLEANAAGVAPPVYLEATDARALDFVDMKTLATKALPVQPKN